MESNWNVDIFNIIFKFSDKKTILNLRAINKTLLYMCIYNVQINNKKHSYFDSPISGLSELKSIKKFLTGQDHYYTKSDNIKDTIFVIDSVNLPILEKRILVKELVIDFHNEEYDSSNRKYFEILETLKKISLEKKKLTIWNEEINVGWLLQTREINCACFNIITRQYLYLKTLELAYCNAIILDGLHELEELILIYCTRSIIKDSEGAFKFKNLRTMTIINCNYIDLKLKIKKLKMLQVYSSENIKFEPNNFIVENLITDYSVNIANFSYRKFR